MIFPSIPAAQRLIASLTAKKTNRFVSPYIRFCVFPNATKEHEGQSADNIRWATFCAVLYHHHLAPEAMGFWRETGDGIASRHAEFALGRFRSLESQCVNDSFCTKPNLNQDNVRGKELISLPPAATTAAEVAFLKAQLAKFAASDSPSQAAVRPQNIFLYQKGLCGIYAVARSLVPKGPLAKRSQSVIYGYVVSFVC